MGDKTAPLTITVKMGDLPQEEWVLVSCRPVDMCAARGSYLVYELTMMTDTGEVVTIKPVAPDRVTYLARLVREYDKEKSDGTESD